MTRERGEGEIMSTTKKQVLITVNSTFTAPGSTDRTEFFSEGQLYQKNGKVYVMYPTLQEDGSQVKTTIIVHSPEKLTLKNSGDAAYSITLQEGVTTENLISYGGFELLVGVHPEQIIHGLDGDGLGDLQLIYRLETNGELLSKNQIEITIKPKT